MTEHESTIWLLQCKRGWVRVIKKNNSPIRCPTGVLNGFPIKNSMMKAVRAQQSTDVPGAEPSAPTGGSLLAHTAVAAAAAAAAAAHTTKWGTS